MIAAFGKGDHDRAQELNASLFDSYAYESREIAQFAQAVKAALRVLGQPAGPCRLPIGPGARRASRTTPAGCSRVSASSAEPHPWPRPSPSRSSAASARSAATAWCSSSDDQLLLLDCGLMFPELEHLGIDLVLPDFTWLRENADRVIGCIATHGHEDHVGGLSYLLRELSFPIYGSALTLGLARNRIEEAGLLDQTELIPVVDGERRKIGPFDVRVHPGHPLGAARLRHRVPHPAGRAHAHRRLEARPHARSTVASPTSPAWAPSPTTQGVRLLLGDSTNADSHGHSRSEKSVGAVLYDLFHEHEGRRIVIACFASHVHRVQQIADAAIAVRPQGRHARPVDEEEHAARPRDGPAAHPRVVDRRHRGHRRPRRRRRLRDLHRQPGRADVGAHPHGQRREPLAHHRRGRHGDPLVAPDPRQRDEREQGDRRPRAPRRQGRALRHRGRARHRPRQAGGDQDAPLDRRAAVVRAGARRVPPPGGQRRARRT